MNQHRRLGDLLKTLGLDFVESAVIGLLAGLAIYLFILLVR